jgi:hypothetical protein
LLLTWLRAADDASVNARFGSISAIPVAAFARREAVLQGSLPALNKRGQNARLALSRPCVGAHTTEQTAAGFSRYRPSPAGRELSMKFRTTALLVAACLRAVTLRAHRRSCADSIMLAGPARNGRGGVVVTSMAFQGAMVSIMILIPANALSISLCTRSTSDFRNICICWTSDMSPSSPSIEVDVNRAMEDLIRSASDSTWVGGFGIFCSTNLLISASTDESNFSARAEDDVGAFIEILRNLAFSRS